MGDLGSCHKSKKGMDLLPGRGGFVLVPWKGRGNGRGHQDECLRKLKGGKDKQERGRDRWKLIFLSQEPINHMTRLGRKELELIFLNQNFFFGFYFL